MKQNRPNIVLIMTDEMRGDCMGAAGHPDVKTPYLDSLAANGIYFPNAQSACPSCVPARAVLHTGLSPQHCGRVGYADGVSWDYPCTLAGQLAKAGYYTQCVGKMHVHPLRRTLGFHNVELHDGYLHHYRYSSVPYGENQQYADDYFYWLKNELGVSADVTATGIDCNSYIARPWCYPEQYHPTNWVTDRSIDFLRRRDPDMPFFLMVSYVRPHAPYDAPQCYFDMYERKKLRPPVSGDWDDREALARQGRQFNTSTGPADSELIRRQQVGYYACITHVDHQIGRLLIALTEHRLENNTVILFTSDHGELLSDHCLSRKSRAYKGSANIPMIVSGPKEFIGAQGVVSENLVELRDVMPTCLALAGAEQPYTDGGNMLTEELNHRTYLHGEHTAGDLSSHWIVTAKDKYVWYSQTGAERYFQLDADPEERHNAVHDAACRERVEELRSLLIRELTGREEGFTDGSQLFLKRPVSPCLTMAQGRNL